MSYVNDISSIYDTTYSSWNPETMDLNPGSCCYDNMISVCKSSWIIVIHSQVI